MVPNILKTSDLVQEITASSEEQSTGVQQISQSMRLLDKVTQESTVAAEGLVSSALEMRTQAEHLQKMMEYFTLDQQYVKGVEQQASSVTSPLRSRSASTGQQTNGMAESHSELDDVENFQ